VRGHHLKLSAPFSFVSDADIIQTQHDDSNTETHANNQHIQTQGAMDIWSKLLTATTGRGSLEGRRKMVYISMIME
jgi:hypothetical protein